MPLQVANQPTAFGIGASVVPICRDHLICRDPILGPCYQSRVMKGKLFEEIGNTIAMVL